MKKIFTLLLLLSAWNITHAQNADSQVRFLEEGKKWEVWGWSMQALLNGLDKYSKPTFSHTLELRGDTVIDGKLCMKLYKQENNVDKLMACFYEDKDGRVFLSSGELFYHFNMKTGETYEFGMLDAHQKSVTGHLSENKTVTVLGKKYDVTCPATNDEGFYGTTWLRGVGNIQNPLCNFGEELEGGTSYYVKKCWVGHEVLFESMGKNAMHSKDAFLTEGKKWEIWIWPASTGLLDDFDKYDEPRWRYTYELRGDTIIDGRTCKRMYKNENGQSELVACFYEDWDGNVFLSNGQLFYNFSMKTGQEREFGIIDSHGGKTEIIGLTEEISTICRLGVDYVVIRTASKDDDFYGSEWVPGVGSIHETLENFTEILEGGASRFVKKCWVGDNVIYESAGKPETTDIHSIITSKTTNNTIYDLSGRKLMQKPQKGFYIQGGKKFLQK